jgi:hypothetical protein
VFLLLACAAPALHTFYFTGLLLITSTGTWYSRHGRSLSTGHRIWG